MKLRTPWQISRSVIFALVLREMQTRFGARRMGAFWMLFEPISHVAVMVLIIAVIRGRHAAGFDYPVFLLAGMVPFFLMRNISLKMMDSVSANKSLFAYPNIKPFDTFVARAIIECALSFSLYVILMAALGFWANYDVGIASPLRWIFALGTGVIFAFGLGLILCVVAEIMPNSRTFIRILFMPLYLLAGIIFPIWTIPSKYLEWLLWNPYLHIVDNLRYSVFDNYPRVEGVSFRYPFECALVVLFVGMALYRAKRRELLAI
ncbi:sugar ABC transporter permease [Achromobacter sp. LC458]|uniref:ABC transporter permease n=1 Tax=Achromobacter sp. LC458 TaxID=1120623 RepID=UPI0009E24D10|nr:ABC transporter permease [Achromobacter sp. LC458]TRM53562.1 sugar ABC transporter permease [Achromobacter sp. LC458]